ncbi:DUF535 family protein [Helicobacter acinonychis]|uniref:DUF535 family protein n=1 Tax=Helicobacter acinonychis TaxID=212 RepID=UPI000CF0D13F|nr:DUF535 family protein [Helicobacter acinonychis]
MKCFFENSFQILDGRIKHSKEEALAVTANIIQILLSSKGLNNIEVKYIEEYTDKASLMGVKLRTIESLLPKGSGSQTTSLLKVQTLTFHRAEIEGGCYHFNLTCNQKFFHERLLGINLCWVKNNTSEFIYRLTFCITHGHSLLISCVQSKKI